MHDLVIRGGTVIDGTGAARRRCDVAVDGGVISEVCPRASRASREIDAGGQLVLPGWVDIHSHYDGQATWDPQLSPSSWHGVTTTVFGNCGVGFAPLRPNAEGYLINLMEGVEDIPGTVLAEGIDFCWESFPQYLDVLEATPHSMDIAAQVPHGALRFYVMGERGADHAQRPTEAEVERMGRVLEEALHAGALGFTTSRTIKHKAADGRPTPSLSADEPELVGLAAAMRRAGKGIIECNSDLAAGELDLLCQAAELAGRPLSVLLLQVDNAQDRWRETLDGIHTANRRGTRVIGQVGCRPISILMGLETSVHPFSTHPAFTTLDALTPRARYQALLRDADLRRRLVEERPHDEHDRWMAYALTRSYALGNPPDYEPDPSTSVESRASASGGNPWALALELMMADEGKGLLLYTFENYYDGNLENIREMLLDEHTVCGLGDAGAHVATVCDASYPTFLLSHWARDRKRGEGLPLEFLVRKQTRDSARSYGLLDRGVIAPGYKADINVIDFDNLNVRAPELVYDLPAGGRRFVQRASGYRHTLVSGVEVARDDAATGELPGRLVRGAQRGPSQ